MNSIFLDEKIILDGGFGTTLESVFRLDISNTPLWSAKAVLEQPDVIVQAHLAFLRAGSDVILTSTYQCSYRTFEKAGYGIAEAKTIFIKSIELAIEARKRFYEENNNSSRTIHIALSLGSFGASLSPAQEFDGYYPPPYGPAGYSPDGNNVNSFGAGDEELENNAVEALADFHLERLLICFEKRNIWDNFDCIAFETVPVLREIKAIRKAMGILAERAKQTGIHIKPWWVSMVFPDGKFPQKARDGSGVGVSDVIKVVLEDSGKNSIVPPALGINCTSIEHIPALVSEMSDAVEMMHGTSDERDDGRPWLVVYPNGGDVYDPVTQTWKVTEGDPDNKMEIWANTLGDIARSHGPWNGFILGGCCRTTFSHIQMLRRVVKRDD